MDLTKVIKRPYNTEKIYILSQGENKKYAFIVDNKATKELIGKAFKIIYGISPTKINVINKKPTSVRNGTKFPGISKAKKIAYITLPKGLDIVNEEDSSESDSK